MNFQIFKLNLEKAKEKQIKFPTSIGSYKKQESSRKTSAAAAKSLQSCPILCDPIDGSPPGTSVPGILQARTLEGCHFLLQCMKVKSECEVAQSCLTLATPWTTAFQAPPSMGFSRQEHWSGVPLPSPVCMGESLIISGEQC